MKIHKSHILVIIYILLIIFSLNTLAYDTNKLDIRNDSIYLEKMAGAGKVDVEKIKEEINLLNARSIKIRQDMFKTKNGVGIYTQSTIEQLEDINTAILMRYELLKHHKENNLKGFLYIKYPLISEVELYGLIAGYNQSYDSEKYIKEQKLNFKDKAIRADFNFFRNQDFDTFIKFIESISMLDMDLNGTNLVFNPYTILSSYGYFENYDIINEKYTRRSRINILAKDDMDYASTFIHELGHQVFNEIIDKDKDLYRLYYNFYKDQFDKHNAESSYIWKERLTECFAEDFKVYISTIMLEAGLNRELILSNVSNFLINDTIYKTNGNLKGYFNKIIKYEPVVYRARPSIGIKLKDYDNNFVCYDNTYTNECINKFFTNSDNVTITIAGLGVMNLKSIKSFDIDNGYNFIKEIKIKDTKFDYITSVKNKDTIIDTKNEYTMDLKGNTLIELEFIDYNGEVITFPYFFTKHR